MPNPALPPVPPRLYPRCRPGNDRFPNAIGAPELTRMPANDPLVGDVLDGRYEVLARLARGGMATVYRAWDRRLERIVAIKVMHEGLGDDADFAAKFDREARAAARLCDQSVVSIFDQGHDHGRPYIVMEFVEGATLRWLFDLSKYPLVLTRWEGVECMNLSPFVYAWEQENIAITGKGTLDGGADVTTWWSWNRKGDKPQKQHHEPRQKRDLAFASLLPRPGGAQHQHNRYQHHRQHRHAKEFRNRRHLSGSI